MSPERAKRLANGWASIVNQNYKAMETQTRVSIEDNNKLIAEFMGAFKEEGQSENILTVTLGDDEWYIDTNDEESTKFHTSWDWLIPVVEKCYEREQFGLSYNDIEKSLTGIIDIESTYKEIVRFIKRYNENK